MKIEDIFIENELLDSYLNYAISVIIGRALPDIRDGLKPVHRRTLFAMKELNNDFNKPYKKSARIVGDVIGKYHPHGEMAVYDSIVRLSQHFVLRYPLIDGQGNFGSIDGDPAAAMRYTEIRISEFSTFLLIDLEYKPVDYINNYDNTESYPSILPTMIPNLLVNGSHGIAVGVTTNIPPHNISEIANLYVSIIDNKKADIKNLINCISGPDFPTSGYITDIEKIDEAYKTGKGKIKIISSVKIEIEEEKRLIIKELPYQVNKAKLIERIFILIKKEKFKNIKSIRDESDKHGLRISIEITDKKKTRIIFKKLQNLTQVAIIFNINMVALVENKPKLLNLKELIENFINYRIEVIYRRTQTIFIKLTKKKHILEGLLIILFNINLFINFINNSKKISDLKNELWKKVWFLGKFSNFLNDLFNKNLINKFKEYKLSKKQIKITSNLKINNLIKIKKDKIYKEYLSHEKNLLIHETILKNENSVTNIIKKEISFIKKKFGDERKTTILVNFKNSLIESEKIINNKLIIISKKLDIKIKDLKNIKTQDDIEKKIFLIKKNTIQKIFINNVYNVLFCFSNLGNIYYINLFHIFLSSKNLKGINIKNFLNLEKEEIAVVILLIKSFKKERYILIITQKAVIKKIFLNEIKKIQLKNKIIINFLKNDILIRAEITKNEKNLIIISDYGRIIKICNKNIKQTNKISRYIKKIKLKKNEKITSSIIFNKIKNIIIITKLGYIKKIKLKNNLNEIKNLKEINIIKTENDYTIKTEIIKNKNDLLLINSNGTIFKMKIESIKNSSRYAKNLLLIKLEKNEFLVYMKNIKNRRLK